MYKYR